MVGRYTVHRGGHVYVPKKKARPLPNWARGRDIDLKVVCELTVYGPEKKARPLPNWARGRDIKVEMG